MSVQCDFLLGGTFIRLKRANGVLMNESFRPFLTKASLPDFTVTFHICDTIEFPTKKPIFSNYAFAVYQDEIGFYRRYHDHKENDRPYALGRIAPNGRSETVEYLANSSEFFSESHNTFSHIALEELLLHRDRLILHASFISSPWGGILFSGPSGVGKSTQADLWTAHENCILINGDRPILGKTKAGWIAYGSPYAGSSNCFRNESCPIGAIALLEQGSTNMIRRLTVGEAFHGLFAQTTVNSWNPLFVERSCDLVADLAASVPVYRMTCTPDHRAVETLKETLEGGG